MQELVIPRVVMNDLPAEIGETTTNALGWAQVHLPAALGSLGGNADLVKKMPQTGLAGEANCFVPCWISCGLSLIYHLASGNELLYHCVSKHAS